ncbi:unnamed protein product [Effrenium voratum]|nr:unnamed protein product [Effrenium voratum]
MNAPVVIWLQRVEWPVAVVTVTVACQVSAGETKLRVSELKFELMKQFLDCEHDSHRRFNIFAFAACRNALASLTVARPLLSTFYNVGLVHEFLAEPLAEANSPVLQLDIGVKAKALLAPSQMGSPELPSETRHLHPGAALSELLQVAKSFLPHLVAPSYRTWVRVFHKDFKEKLRFRGESQHAKCNACERFKAFKREAATTSEMVAAAYVQRLDAVMRDRRADALWRQAAALSMTSGHSALDCSSQSSWLGITVDGMDISKFKVPLNVCKSKEFQAMHRPELKLTLAVVDGQVERFFLSDPTVGATANKDLIIITHCIEAALQETLKRGLPKESAETKNQTSFKYGAFLVFCDIFDDFVFTYFRAGHSHGLPDQRFSEVRHHLFASDVLQHPEDFLRIINQVLRAKVEIMSVRPREGRVLQAETLSSQWNFKAWLEQLPCFVPEEAHPLDICLLVKAHMQDVELWCLSHAMMSQLVASGWPQANVPLNELGKDAVCELRKTQQKILQSPWRYERAAA